MPVFILTISSLTTSNLPWFMDLTFQVPMHYCSLQHWNFTSITSHIHNWVLFLLRLSLFILSGVISPLISSSILGTYQAGEFLFQYPIILPFHTVHGVLKARILKCFAIPFCFSKIHDVLQVSLKLFLPLLSIYRVTHVLPLSTTIVVKRWH